MNRAANGTVLQLIGEMRADADAALAAIEFLEAVTETLWVVHGEAIERRRFENEASGSWDEAQQRLALEDEDEDGMPF